MPPPFAFADTPTHTRSRTLQGVPFGYFIEFLSDRTLRQNPQTRLILRFASNRYKLRNQR